MQAIAAGHSQCRTWVKRRVAIQAPAGRLSAMPPIATVVAAMRRTQQRSSRPEEFHLQALPEPCVNLSIHTAPDVRPLLCHNCQ